MTGLKYSKIMKKIFKSVMWMIILFILVSPLDVYCQIPENIKFTHITTEDGLSHHEVLFVLQDTQGFMWFGTKQGLNKYDGMNITSYLYDYNSNKNSLTGNFAHWIHEDQTGALWIATWGDGISRYDPKFDKFTNYNHIKNNPQSIASNNVWSLFVDSNGFVWAATDDGLSKLNPETKTFVHYRHDSKNPNSLSHNTISRIQEDDQGIFWISTYGGGLNRFDPKTEIFTNYKHRQDDPKSLSNDNLWSVFIDSRNRIWIGSEKGLNQFDKKTERFTSYQHDKTDPNSLSSNTITFIHEDHAGILWLGTFGGGLNRFDPEQKTFVHYRHDPLNSRSLANDTIMSVYEDTTGSIWVATYGGVDKYDPGEHRFGHYNTTPNNPKGLSNPKVRSIFQDSKGSIWVGTGGGGLNQLNKAIDSFDHFFHDAHDQTSIGDNDIWAIDQDKRGDLWIATQEAGLNKFIPAQKTFIRYKHDPNDSNTPACNPLYDLKVDKKRDVLWIAAYLSGLDKFDIVNKTFTHYGYDPDNPDGIVSNWSTTVFVDSKGFVWVGTEAGLSRFNPETELFTNFKHIMNDPKSLSANMIQAIFEDSRNIIWIGTGDGLNRYEEATHSFKRYSEKDGLAGNHVAGITEDNKGHLWVSTDKGLSKFNPQNKEFRNYDQRDGLQGNRFLMHSAYSNESGELFFGGTNGFNFFNPNELRDNQHVPRVVFTDLLRFNQPVPIGEGSSLTHHINHSKQILLDHDKSVFRIEFATLNYRNAKKNQYAYMMEGFDKDFTYTDSNNRSATYTNLDSGHYTFHVKGSNNDGVWNEESKSIKLIIHAPWWETLWFKGAIFMLVAGFIFGIMRFRMHEIKKLNKHLEMQVEDRTVKLQNELKERKQAELKLVYNKLQLDAVFDNINTSIYIADMDSHEILFMNSHMIKLFGKNFKGKLCWKSIHSNQSGPCDFCTNDKLIDSDGNPNKPYVWESYNEHLNQWYEQRDQAIPWIDGRLVRMEMATNITERKTMEEALQESEAKYREFVDRTEDIVTRVDNKGNFIFINHTAEKLFGIKSDDCAGLSAFDFIHPDDKEKTVQAFAEWGEKKLTSHGFENRMIDFAGKTRFLTWSFNIHYETDGTIKHLNSIAKDITALKQIQMDLNNELQARKQVEEQRETLLGDLVRANSELKDFSYTVSHDLKAPLRGISSIAQWLSEDYSDSLDKKGQEYLDKLLLRTKRMHDLIQGILQYSRVGRTKVELQQLDSKIIFQEISDNTALPENVTITITEPLPIIKYDKTLFIQVFQNLIENAVQHLDKPSGEVVVACMDQGDSWEFCVKDNGVGIDEKHQDRIFKIFQSLKPHSVDGSTGIGLTLVKKIIENNGGKIRLESVLDEGSSFFITIPKELKPEKTGTCSTVLIIDDNIDFTKVAVTMLQRDGYKVLNASTGPEAYEIIETTPETISIVLFDLYIPGEDSLERFNTLKQLKPDMKIIVCSGNTIENIDLTQMEFDGILTKPFTINELNNLLKDKLEK